VEADQEAAERHGRSARPWGAIPEREIKAAIYLIGTARNLRVVYDIPDEACEIPVPNAIVGNVIVRALRKLQRSRAGRGAKT
jgi:hypothetical protein